MTALQKWDEPQPVKLTTSDFLHLHDTGAFADYAKTELLEGVIVAMNAQFSNHARAKSILFRRLADAVDAAMPGYEAWSEASVAIPPLNMPEPDILVTNFRPSERAPVPADTVALVVEVADTTARVDLGQKARIYAAAGVREYWVLDLARSALHQHWEASPGGYAQKRQLGLGERIESATIEGVGVETSGLR